MYVGAELGNWQLGIRHNAAAAICTDLHSKKCDEEAVDVAPIARQLTFAAAINDRCGQHNREAARLGAGHGADRDAGSVERGHTSALRDRHGAVIVREEHIGYRSRCQTNGTVDNQRCVGCKRDWLVQLQCQRSDRAAEVERRALAEIDSATNQHRIHVGAQDPNFLEGQQGHGRKLERACAFQAKHEHAGQARSDCGHKCLYIDTVGNDAPGGNHR